MNRMRKCGKSSCTRGFTLVEVLITVAILAVIMGVISTLFISGLKSFSLSQRNSDLQNDTRLSLEIIQNEIRYAEKIFIVDGAEAREHPEEGYSYIYLDEDKLKVMKFESLEEGYETMVLPGLYEKNQEVFEIIPHEVPAESLVLGVTLNARLDETSFALRTEMKMVNIDAEADEDFGQVPGAPGLAVKYLK
jgi:prepilin-type N-terminal cleavage/methylation domain-containing protein